MDSVSPAERDTCLPWAVRELRSEFAMYSPNLPAELQDGAEAVLSLGKGYRVEISDDVLSGLERVFGEQVAELR